VSSHAFKKAICTKSRTNETICEVTSRTLGKITMAQSFQYEQLINEADVRTHI